MDRNIEWDSTWVAGMQDALAVLVAAEMKKVLQKELAPVAPPRLVNSEPLMDEIEALQVWINGRCYRCSHSST